MKNTHLLVAIRKKKLNLLKLPFPAYWKRGKKTILNQHFEFVNFSQVEKEVKYHKWFHSSFLGLKNNLKNTFPPFPSAGVVPAST